MLALGSRAAVNLPAIVTAAVAVRATAVRTGYARILTAQAEREAAER